MEATMTTLLIQTDNHPVSVELPSLSQMTEQEFYEFCAINRELRIERTATGEVIVMAPAFSDTSDRNFKIAGQLSVWTEQDETGLGFDSSAGFTLPNGATRSPDASWIKLDRWNALTDEQKASFAPICPDFVIELRSASDTLAKLQNKMQEYIDNGAALGLLIDRKNRRVYIYRPNHDIEEIDNPDGVSCDPELPGFVLKMNKIW
jgi:Uma2 family endonuclease